MGQHAPVMGLRRRWLWAAAAAACVLVLAFGLRGRQVRPPADPAFRALAVVTLARDGAQHPLTRDQIRAIAPLLRSLRDIAPDEREAAQAVVREILNTLTSEQRAELRNRRPFFAGPRAGQPGPNGSGLGGGGRRFPDGGGGGVAPQDRLQMRARLIDRAVSFLEERAKE